jgi:hypothetical protein
LVQGFTGNADKFDGIYRRVDLKLLSEEPCLFAVKHIRFLFPLATLS